MLLIAIDTLRADGLGCYGNPRATSPNLDALAAAGLRFTHVQTPRAKTTPAMASVMTGLYPHDHGVRDLTAPLAGDVPTLAEAFARAGYRTGAVIGNYVLRADLAGLHRGFDHWDEELPDLQGVPPEDVPQRRAGSLTDAALALLGLADRGDTARGAPAGEPWFVWLHYMDPHGLYDPPAAHLVPRGEPRPLEPPAPGLAPAWREPVIATYNVPADAWLPDGRIDVARVEDAYEGEVRHADHEIGRLLHALEAAGALEDTWVVVLSDHGESFGEHDYWFEHGRYAYEATCRVPLIVHPPLGLARRPAPGLRRSDLSLADLAPTLLELCGLPALPPPSGTFRGRSRAGLWLAGDEGPRPVFCEKVEAAGRAGAVQTKAVRQGDWKLLRRYAQRDDAGAARLELLGEELYDLLADPREERDLARDPPAGAPLEELRDLLIAFGAADGELADLARRLRERREELGRRDPEALRRLEAMGY